MNILSHNGPRIARPRELPSSGAQRAQSTYRIFDIPDERRLAMLASLHTLLEAPSIPQKFRSGIGFSSSSKEETPDDSAMTLLARRGKHHGERNFTTYLPNSFTAPKELGCTDAHYQEPKREVSAMSFVNRIAASDGRQI